MDDADFSKIKNPSADARRECMNEYHDAHRVLDRAAASTVRTGTRSTIVVAPRRARVGVCRVIARSPLERPSFPRGPPHSWSGCGPSETTRGCVRSRSTRGCDSTIRFLAVASTRPRGRSRDVDARDRYGVFFLCRVCVAICRRSRRFKGGRTWISSTRRRTGARPRPRRAGRPVRRRR